eukprot:CAMPEP_0171062818 /NCGR_PEP_ID=MMETSP0766_2-20121228/5262_1 /TAXON_ID=439317 /ORGANISM="Gambierdiscus australes, Strain CAWD 149" /LENGTH=70 /DNA_ID=CAMNT_0011518631 /DNA_START=16 /DNA_END=224 /DNA_ORIENTATION=+
MALTRSRTRERGTMQQSQTWKILLPVVGKRPPCRRYRAIQASQGVLNEFENVETSELSEASVLRETVEEG